MKGASTVHGFKRSLESAGQQQHANGGGARPGGERRRIGFHKARNPKNGFVSLSTLKAGAAGGASQHGKGKGGKHHSQQQQQQQAPAHDSRDGGAASGGGIGPGLPAPEKGLFPESRILEVMSWKKVQRTGPGLYNLGNTCFLNATLQCLAYLPPLAQFVLVSERCYVGGHGGDKGGASGQGAGGFMRNLAGGRDWYALLREVLVNMHGKGGGGSGHRPGHVSVHDHHRAPISPKQIVANLKGLNKHFRVGRQEDAHEFLRHLVDVLQNACLKAERVKANAPHRLAETTFVHRIFAGYLRSQVKCTSCGFCSNTYETFLDLSLEIHGRVGTLEEALARFTAVETLDKANRWKCSSCQQMVCAKKQLTVYSAPNVCTVQFKRFMFGSRSSKIGKGIAYPEQLRLPVSGPEKQADYRLTGVLVHAGASVNMGHYYSYVRAPNGLWYEMDDSRVTQVGLQTVMRQHAYLLFYVKTVKPRPPVPFPPAAAKPPVVAAPEEPAEPSAMVTTPTKAKAPAQMQAGAAAAPKRPETPGWSDVLARLREEDAREEDHTKDLRPSTAEGEGPDTSWSQPAPLAAFVRGQLGKEGEEEDVGVGVAAATAAAATAPVAVPGKQLQQLQEEDTPDSGSEDGGEAMRVDTGGGDDEGSEEGSESESSAAASAASSSSSRMAEDGMSSVASERSFMPALDLGRVVYGYHYAGKFIRTRFSAKRRWQRIFSIWPRDRRQEGETFLGEPLVRFPDDDEKETEGRREEKENAAGGSGNVTKKALAEAAAAAGGGEAPPGKEGKAGAKGQEPPPLPKVGALQPAQQQPPQQSKRRKAAGAAAEVVIRRDEEAVVLVPRHKRKGGAAGGGGSGKGGGRPFDPRALAAARDRPLGAVVGQWGDEEEDGDEDGDAALRRARDGALAVARREEQAARAKRQLSEFAQAAIQGKKKKVKGDRGDAWDAAEAAAGGPGAGPNPFDAKQEQLQHQRQQPRQHQDEEQQHHHQRRGGFRGGGRGRDGGGFRGGGRGRGGSRGGRGGRGGGFQGRGGGGGFRGRGGGGRGRGRGGGDLGGGGGGGRGRGGVGSRR